MNAVAERSSNRNTQRVVDLREEILPAFHSAFVSEKRYLILLGGAGSGKSWFAAQKVILRCLREPGHLFLVLRKVAATLRNSVFRRIRAQIVDWGLAAYVRVSFSEMKVSFHNGSEIIFSGLDDVEKLKSIDSVTSIWFEEATEGEEEDFTQIDLRLRGQSRTYKQILLSFNPVSTFHWIKLRFFDMSGAFCIEPDTYALRTTYRDNPTLDKEYIVVLKKLESTNPAMFAVYGNGVWGVMTGLIYSPITHVSDKDYPQSFQKVLYGLDFGFNNPMALIEVGLHDVSYKTKLGKVYLREKLYETELTIPNLHSRMKEIGIPQNAEIIADSAEPGQIKQLKDMGWKKIRGSHKGTNSVRAGIVLLQGLELHTHAGNVNLNGEFASYSWEDKKVKDTPTKFNDHALDATRYAIYTDLTTHLRKIRGGGR